MDLSSNLARDCRRSYHEKTKYKWIYATWKMIHCAYNAKTIFNKFKNFKIEHKKGTENILADALSRLNLPVFEDEEPTRVEKLQLGGTTIWERHGDNWVP